MAVIEETEPQFVFAEVAHEMQVSTDHRLRQIADEGCRPGDRAADRAGEPHQSPGSGAGPIPLVATLQPTGGIGDQVARRPVTGELNPYQLTFPVRILAGHDLDDELFVLS